MNKKNILILLIFFFTCVLNSQAQLTNDHEQGKGFVQNNGQVVDINYQQRNDILFTGESGTAKIFLRKQGISYVVNNMDWVLHEEEKNKGFENKEVLQPLKDDDRNYLMQRIDLDFVGANNSSSITSVLRSAEQFNFFLSYLPHPVIDVHSYKKVTYNNIYNNIDVACYTSDKKGFKYDINVNPGGNVNDVAMQYTGAENIKIENGVLKIKTAFGEMGEFMPRIYQIINGEIIDVPGKYIYINNPDENKTKEIGFAIGSYDHNLTLTIDPWVTFLGGNGNDEGKSVAIEPNTKDVIFSGTTNSVNFPVTAGAIFQGSLSGGNDAFVCRFNSNGNLLWLSYLGGNGSDNGAGVCLNSVGEILLAGNTTSSSLPRIGAGSFQNINGGATDGFIMKLSSTGIPVWSTYYGGNLDDGANDITCDINDNVIATGYTMSANYNVTANAFQNNIRSIGANLYDAFVIKFNTAGTRVWNTYFGGSGKDIAYGIDADPQGNIAIVGSATKFQLINDFPATPGAFQTKYYAPVGVSGLINNPDAFIAKFKPNGVIDWATIVGGPSPDYGFAVAFENTTGDIAISGSTWSSGPFPFATANAYQGNRSSVVSDAFVARFNATGQRQFATYIGGSFGSYSTGVDFSSNGDITIAGDVYDANFPITSCSYQHGFEGSEDNFLAVFTGDLDSLVCSTYLGKGVSNGLNNETFDDSFNEGGGCLAVDGGFAYIAASSPGTYPTTANAYQQNGGGSYDAAFSKLCLYTCGNPGISINISSITQVCVGKPVDYMVHDNSCDTAHSNYLWSFTGATPSFSTDKNPIGIRYNAVGIYPVKLVVTTPCGSDSSVQNNYMTVVSPRAIINSLNNVACFGGATGSASVGAVGATPPYNYSWSGIFGTNVSVSGLSANTYSVTITDATGCSSTTAVTITQSPLLTSTLTSSPVKCNGTATGTANVSVNGGTPRYSYYWSASGQTSQNATGLAAGISTVTVTDQYGCTSSNSINVTEPTVLTATASITSTVSCNGGNNGSMSVGASGGTTPYFYSWTGNTSTTNSANSLTANVYTVTVTDNNGCTETASNTITEPAPIILSFTTTPAHCNQNDGTATVDISGGNPGYAYNWNNGPINMPTFVNGVSTCTVQGTDVSGCPFSGTITIHNVAGVVASISNATPNTCFNSCDGSATALGIGGNGPYQYSWSSSGNNITETNLCSGRVTITITDADGCHDTASVNILQPAPITTTLSSTPASCFNSANGIISVTQTAGGNGNYSYFWNGSPGGPTTTGLTHGSYSLTVNDANGCSAIFSASVSAPPQLIVNTTDVSACRGNSLSLGASANGGTPGYVYQWGNGIGSGSSASFVPVASGIISVTVTDAHNCIAIASSSVTVLDLPTVEFTSDNISGCAPLCVTLSNQTPNTHSLSWNFGDNTTPTSSDPAQHCYNAGTYNVSLIVTDNNGCSNSATKNNFITVHQLPNANFITNPTSPTITDPIVYFYDRSVGANAWQWNFGAGSPSSSSDKNPNTVFDDTTCYRVSLIVSNEFGCRDIIEKEICIRPDFSLFTPNTFTPNGDGKNETFIPQGVGIDIDEYALYIYDRWGNLIFTSNNLSVGWDGRANDGATVAQQDTYIWKLKLKDVLGKKHAYTGSVNLLR